MLDDGILTVSYEFPATAADNACYERADSAESGEQYLIVAKSGDAYYALTAVPTIYQYTAYLIGTPVTVSGDMVLDEDVRDTMLWTFTKANDAAGYEITTTDCI